MFAVTETPVSNEPSAAGEPDRLRVRYRVRFAKVGLLRWISHRDLARLWERLVRRAALDLSMTEGFHPKPRIGFPSALALGVESLDEVVELELAEELAPGDLLSRLQDDQQPGLTILSVGRLPEGFGKAQLLRADYVITIIDSADLPALEQSISQLKDRGSVTIPRKGKTITAIVETQIPDLAIRDGKLHLAIAASDSASLRPADVLELLGIGDWIQRGAMITRTRVTLHREFESDNPQLMAFASTASSRPGLAPPPTL